MVGRPTQKKERFTHKTLMPIDRLRLARAVFHVSKIHGSGGERKPRLREFNDSYLKAQQAGPQDARTDQLRPGCCLCSISPAGFADKMGCPEKFNFSD